MDIIIKWLKSMDKFKALTYHAEPINTPTQLDGQQHKEDNAVALAIVVKVKK